MKEMYNNYDEEEEDWDKPEVIMLYTWVHSLNPFFKQKKARDIGCFYLWVNLTWLILYKPEVNSGQNLLFGPIFT